ncbi:RNA-directed DNA polymerase, eukaryota, Reverse transcriptase zinc-binding domain protein [Artemisia annua]|uniref:RNA-directed DNA polymerase, eukaryota, Reverse transcriptase zinc-binding domain protein n=1 Tax=Artemisia annua TaxID=35608 RepID=A0A2U1PLH0_ARTAN|nr:RNA-directed DNA polymerase, eukaryota, Reverse transcriptase zinc-binding domain protein [Artemisia annua]
MVDLMVLSQSNQALHGKVVHKATTKTFFCSFIYAGNTQYVRRQLWTELGLHKLVVRDASWILMGDFNVALNMEDTYSGSSTMNLAMCEFKDCVSKIEVLDINSIGLDYTWNQKPRGVMPYRISDHSLAVLTIPSLVSSKPKPFKFYNFLSHKNKFQDLVSTHWNVQVEGHTMFKVVSKMRALKKPFRKLLHDHGNLHDKVIKLRHELDAVQKALDFNPADLNLRDEEAAYNMTFTEAKLDEERFLKQKAKVD